MERDIAMKALVEGHEAEQICRWFGGGRRAFSRPKKSGEVVGFAADSAFPQVKTLGCNFVLQQATGKFKVRVGDGTGLGGGSQLTLNV